jgi:hypothetical protein
LGRGGSGGGFYRSRSRGGEEDGDRERVSDKGGESALEGAAPEGDVPAGDTPAADDAPAGDSPAAEQPQGGGGDDIQVPKSYLGYAASLIQQYDANGNQVLEKDEWSKMAKDPGAADTDKDGRITAKELALFKYQGN